MSHNVSPVHQKNAIFCLSAALLLLQVPIDTAAQDIVTPAQPPAQQIAPKNKPAVAEKNSIIQLTAQRTGNNLEITVFCAKPPDYTPPYELPGSERKGIVIDIANTEVSKAANLGAELTAFKVTLGGIDKPDAQTSRVRLEFQLPEPYVSYTASLKENNIVLLIEKFFKDDAAASASANTAPFSIPATTTPANQEETKQGSSAAPNSQSLETQLPTVIPAIKNPGGMGSSGAAAGGPLAGSSPLGGGSGTPISVDFYKVDLHNVFRLLGEISGSNIIVAEGVSGTLTLALHEVPWDFVLDVILNLKDLAKEQRFNTIVIYPKSKEFVWPERSAAETSLSIEPEAKPKSPIVIQGGAGMGQEQLPEVVEAKKIVTLGIRAEKEGSLETAVQLYEKGLDIWPDKVDKKEKSKLANKIASLYLAKLNQNAKAVYYAKKALAADKKNSSAALNAAIGHANMEEASQAQQYFDQSISSSTPSREALFSYAVFSERQRQYEAALKLLNKYSELYGEDLNSMVARARILDQQGQKEQADKAYTAILHAGFSVPQDLRAYITSRIQSN